MQTAVQHLPPQVLPSYPSLNRLPNSNLSAMPTPPIATGKRKRTRQVPVDYTEVQEVDSSGRVRNVIVLEDTPPPTTASPATSHLYSASYQPPLYSAPIRTRARAAAEAQALSASTSSAVVPPPPPKKRKRDPHDSAGTLTKKTLTTNGHLQTAPSTNKSWPSVSAAATDDVRLTLPIPSLPFRSPTPSSGVKGSSTL